MSTPPSEPELDAMLAEALAQYHVHPSEYLEGTVAGLIGLLDVAPDRSWCDPDAQERNAAGRAPTSRVRDYLNGTKAAMEWAVGTGAAPVSVVLTERQEPDSQEPSR